MNDESMEAWLQQTVIWQSMHHANWTPKLVTIDFRANGIV